MELVREKNENAEPQQSETAKCVVVFQMPTGLADGLGVESLPRPNWPIRPCRQRENAVGAAGTVQACGHLLRADVVKLQASRWVPRALQKW